MELPVSLSNVCQICLLVKDIKKTMDYYASLGIGPFHVYELDTNDLENVVYRGKPANYGIAVSWTQVGSWTLELLEPKFGESIYKEFMDEHGEGLHHMGIYLESEEEYIVACKFMESQGCERTMGGNIYGKDKDGNVKKGSFDYFDTQDKYGAVFELLDMPDELGEPDYIYPEK